MTAPRSAPAGPAITKSDQATNSPLERLTKETYHR